MSESRTMLADDKPIVGATQTSEKRSRPADFDADVEEAVRERIKQGTIASLRASTVVRKLRFEGDAEESETLERRANRILIRKIAQNAMQMVKTARRSGFQVLSTDQSIDLLLNTISVLNDKIVE